MTDPETDTAPLLSARGISKQFGGIEVLTDIDLDLMRGEIHALLGENGAGKSTFAKIWPGCIARRVDR
jgi:rhamnose transport system ATP-binding protein